MVYTSTGYHTFSFFQKLSEEDYLSLCIHFRKYQNQNPDMKGYPIKDQRGNIIGWKYSYRQNKGIQWMLLCNKAKNGFSWQGITSIINPKALVESNYIVAAGESDLEVVEEIFNQEVARISPILWQFGRSSVNRADFCMNLDVKELGLPCAPEQMMALLKRGNIPKHYQEWSVYDQKLHRQKTDKSSFYLQGKSVNINYYWKYPQQADDRHPNFLFREASRNVIRLEVQYKYLKLYPLAKHSGKKSKYEISWGDFSLEEFYERIQDEQMQSPSVLVDVILSNEIANQISRKYFFKIIGKGDYFILDLARKIVQSYHYRHDKEERMLFALEMVNQYHGIARAKSKLPVYELPDFKRSIKDLNSIMVNPVTIPRRWGMCHIPNLIRAYDNCVYEEEVLWQQEYLARQRIAEFLSGAGASCTG